MLALISETAERYSPTYSRAVRKVACARHCCCWLKVPVKYVVFKCLSAARYRVYIIELYQFNLLVHSPGNAPNNIFYIEAQIGTIFQNTLLKEV